MESVGTHSRGLSETTSDLLGKRILRFNAEVDGEVLEELGDVRRPQPPRSSKPGEMGWKILAEEILENLGGRDLAGPPGMRERPKSRVQAERGRTSPEVR